MKKLLNTFLYPYCCLLLLKRDRLAGAPEPKKTPFTQPFVEGVF
jgi:hypothetical protein